MHSSDIEADAAALHMIWLVMTVSKESKVMGQPPAACVGRLTYAPGVEGSGARMRILVRW